VSRVHPSVEQIDGLALARTVHAADDDDDRKPVRLREIVLRIEQRFAQPRLLACIPRLVDRVTELGRLEHVPA